MTRAAAYVCGRISFALRTINDMRSSSEQAKQTGLSVDLMNVTRYVS